MRHRLSLQLPNNYHSLDPDNLDSEKSQAGDIQKFDKEKLLQLSIKIIKKPPFQRNEKQIDIIIQMSVHLQFFKDIRKNYGVEVHRNLMNCLRYQYLPAGETLFKVGDKGTRFYVILQGSVGIYILLPKQSQSTNKEFEQKRINFLSNGDSFGELALIYEQSLRSATIIGERDCDLAYVEKIDYEKVIGSYQRSKINQKIDFLSQLLCFQNWSKREIITISYHFIQVNVKYQEVIYEENDPAQFLYFILEGYQKINLFKFDREFELVKNFPKQNFKSLRFKDIPLNTINKNSIIKKTLQSTSLVILFFKNRCILQKGQMFGEECFFSSDIENELKIQPSITRTSTVFCRSIKGSLYRIAKQDILERFWDPQTKSHFRQMIQNVKKFREERMQILKTASIEINEQQEEFYKSVKNPKVIKKQSNFKY